MVMGRGNMRQRRGDYPRYVIALAVGAAVVVLGVTITLVWQSFTSPIDKSGYQLVKLTNGEMFFGKLQNTTGDYLRLEDAYFIPATTETTTTNKSTPAEVELIPRSATVAKSKTPMYLRTDQVAYWENLATDSKVADTLKSGDR